MFKSKFNDKKFKTNVRLCINRLKLVEKKKTEMALKARKEIADYIKIGKAGNYRRLYFRMAGVAVTALTGCAVFSNKAWHSRQGHFDVTWVFGGMINMIVFGDFFC